MYVAWRGGGTLGQEERGKHGCHSLDVLEFNRYVFYDLLTKPKPFFFQLTISGSTRKKIMHHFFAKRKKKKSHPHGLFS
jgi:hypothetical protein